MLVAQRPVRVDRNLGTEQVRSRPLELEHVEQVSVIREVPSKAARRGEGQGGDPVSSSQPDQLGGVQTDLPLGRGRQVHWLGKRLAHTRQSTGHRLGLGEHSPLLGTGEPIGEGLRPRLVNLARQTSLASSGSRTARSMTASAAMCSLT